MSLDGSPYQGYLYAYPHKTAYRRLEPRPLLSEVWAHEPTSALFAYVHIPFCEIRCGFCNLFTRTRPPAEQVTAYLAQIDRQARAVRDALGDRPAFARLAIGGGTPTYLTAPELERLFAVVGGTLGAAGVPATVETSPATATPDRMAVLADHGVTRVSIGVQSFLESEARAAVRPQKPSEVQSALETIRAGGVPALNLDLIYGIDGQTRESWHVSLTQALRWHPEEIFLYPLYVRPLTGLDRRARTVADWDAQRLDLYRYAVDFLKDAGYVQDSMRQFRRADAPADEAPDYSCQDDGMVGLGCGARSYTRDLHYSFDYAVSVPEVRAVIDDYVARPAGDFRYAEFGFNLDEGEQRRRWLVKSLLRAEGIDSAAYEKRFGTRHDDDFPQLRDLTERGWLEAGHTRLTAEGLAHSDSVGPWLVSGPVRAAMAAHTLR
ncbi:STM4012 family radical SAM protein [Kineosporia sp. J2-2]|uniref:Heme chaperone HemW n=1 Tax=Kineosporia corallincola TaxID=2835133 RepID=A0ABS5TQX8_9ACTN|nr:STM4012 family radical SAM protein [Kineosporia corallincola]MBT0772813.1 STM4012 family radical SAM protein [Kineosporia corallincola]